MLTRKISSLTIEYPDNYPVINDDKYLEQLKNILILTKERLDKLQHITPSCVSHRLAFQKQLLIIHDNQLQFPISILYVDNRECFANIPREIMELEKINYDAFAERCALLGTEKAKIYQSALEMGQNYLKEMSENDDFEEH